MLTMQQILQLHDKILEASGGRPGVRDAGRIEAVLARPFAGYAGQELFPRLEDKAAALTHGFAKGHAFVDGNKRTAIAAGGIFLMLNGRRLTASQEALEEATVDVAEDRLEVSELAEWFQQHSEPAA
jgi:death-on-curing protein